MSLKVLEELTQILTQQRELFERLPDPACVADKHNRFIKVNPAFTKALGWQKEELQGTRYIDLVHPEDVDGTIRASDTMHGSSVKQYRNRYRHKEGGYVTLEWNATAYDDNGLTCAVARVVDE